LGPAAITFRVIKVDPAATYEGWMWLDGYQLDPSGTAVDRRQFFVQHAGLRMLTSETSASRTRPPNARRDLAATTRERAGRHVPIRQVALGDRHS
jgi:hypothetical protein